MTMLMNSQSFDKVTHLMKKRSQSVQVCTWNCAEVVQRNNLVPLPIIHIGLHRHIFFQVLCKVEELVSSGLCQWDIF